MKRFIALAIILFALPVYAADITASWTHNGLNTTGYTLYFWQTATPGTVWNKSAVGSTVREIKIDENRFAFGVEYTFVVTASNASYETPYSASATWTRQGTAPVFTRPEDKLPSVMYMAPSNIDTLVIQLK